MTLTAQRAPRRADPRRIAPWLVGALALLAWVALGLAGRTPLVRYLDHGDGLHAGLGGAAFIVLAWVVMIVAMMLPTALPLVNLFARMVHQRRDRWVLLGLLGVGYVGAWTAFGVVAHLGDRALHAAVGHVGFVVARPWLIPAALFAAAGIYQVTPLKYVCLDRCRSPRSFVVRHWRGGDARRSALALGAHHGLHCVGCCWLLMVLMFGISSGNVAWMLGLGAVMAAEKNLPRGRALSAPLGVALAVTGFAIAITGAL